MGKKLFVLFGVWTAGEAGSKACEMGGRVKLYGFADRGGVGAVVRVGGWMGSGGGARVLFASMGA